ncbi:MAG: SNF2-related protein [bacterium]
MELTDYQAKYLAFDLTRRCSSDSLEKLAGTVAGAQVDLNPHQVDAALFAFNSPLSRGALLADEVGLGKTIEAGLVVSQQWAERKRRILIITPSNLRKQWHQEMSEKFFLPCRILETKPYNEAIRRGIFRPFDNTDAVTICSYQFARNKAGDVATTPWDLVVIDEAHRLRNVYKPNNIIANTIRNVLKACSSMMLTRPKSSSSELAQHQRHERALARRQRLQVRPPETRSASSSARTTTASRSRACRRRRRRRASRS